MHFLIRAYRLLDLEYLSTLLAKNRALRKKLGFKWLIIKCIDPDGARLNEGWFKGKFTPLKFVLNYYRPPSNEQVEWTFPIHYKTLHWDQTLPEAKILMQLIEEYKPNFMYSLHNAGFCGVYFYVTRNFPSLFKKFRELVRAEELPLYLGEPEMPYIKKLGDAIFEEFGTAKAYDFYQQHGCKDPSAIKLVPSPKESNMYLSFKDYIEKFSLKIKPLKLHAKTAKEYVGKATPAQWFDT